MCNCDIDLLIPYKQHVKILCTVYISALRYKKMIWNGKQRTLTDV